MQVLIYGSREFAAVARDLAAVCGHDCVGHIDDISTGEGIIGNYNYCREHLPPTAYGIVLAIGYKDLSARWAVYEKIRRDGYELPTLVHPRAYVRDLTKIGAGTMVMANAVVDVEARIDELVVLWPGVVVNHHSVVGANSFVSPNATICGCTKIGSNCFIGAGAVVVDHVDVPDRAFVRAGGVFTSNTLVGEKRRRA